MADKCAVCGRDPKRTNNDHAECSHGECPHRKVAWADRPQPGYRAPDEYQNPLNDLFDKEQ